ncbi:MAG: dihydroxyacetone kinase subunit DhaL [Candidatus Latescibacterota bacterium]
MGKSKLTVAETRDMFLHVCGRMEESKDLLTQADKAVGDGDHGIGMSRGFEAVRLKLEGASFGSVDELLKTIGLTLLTSIGGAAGAVFGTWFRGGARNLGGKEMLDGETFSQMLCDGLEAVKQRGGAQPGDKTMVDALEPAAQKARELSAAPLDEVLSAVAEAAREGMERTKEMVAGVGKAKPLGERSLGHCDPGSVSTYLILNAMREYAAG